MPGATLAHVAAPWVSLGFAIVLVAVGGVLVTNCRHLATKHVRAAQRLSPRLRRRPADLAPTVLLDRIIGGVFALIGVAMLLMTVIDLIVGPGRLVHYGR